MKRSMSILIVYVLIFLFPLNTLAVGSNTVTYSTEEVFDNVRVTIPNDLPKTTRITIDGKSLYVHRANYQIIDMDLIK